jgi:hypothetical protein
MPEPPSALLETSNGYYLGTNLGEFGGKLAFRSKQGQWSTIVDLAPVHSIIRFGNSIVAAIVGVFDDTHLYRISEGGTAALRAPWLDLPGLPFHIEARRNHLVVETSKGVFEVSADGKIREGSCASWSE